MLSFIAVWDEVWPLYLDQERLHAWNEGSATNEISYTVGRNPI